MRAALLTAAAVALVPTMAFAQQVDVQVQGQYQPQQPVYVQQAPPPPQNSVAPNGQYYTPMQQQTQQTYVPQSVAFSGPRVIRDWHEGDPIPPGYHPATRMRTGLVAGGISMFAAPYLISVIVAAGNANTGSDNVLYIPVLGPFIDLGNQHSYDASSNALAGVFLVLDGVLQATGVALTIWGLAVPKTVLVRNDLGALKNVRITPMVAKNMTGLGVAAQF